MKLAETLFLAAALAGLTIAAPLATEPLPPLAPAKLIALTFDDAPRAPGAFYTKDERARLLVAGLREAGVEQAAFFLNPGRIAKGDGAAERIAAYAAAGHVLADHSFSHRDLSSQSPAAFLADIDQAEAWLRGRPGYRPWFRFPGLNQGGRDMGKRRVVLAGLAARGLFVAPVTIDGSDWNMERLALDAAKAGKPIDDAALRDLYVETMVRSADFGDALMRRAIGRSPAHVILLHETDLAARYIVPLVEALRRDRWRIVTADDAFADPIYHEPRDGRSANGTLPEAIGTEKGVAGPLWYERNDIRLADALFAARVLHAVTPVSSALATGGTVATWRRPCVVRHRPSRRLCRNRAFTAGRTSRLGTAA
ncbi:MAG: polysaccharide deacetylase family protein [Sphingomonas sp.]